MLALAIISTVILSIFILAIFGTIVTGEVNSKIGFITILLFSFVIVAIWVLYAR